ncbi:MAG: iron-sulfur cluster carrier protein ApbC, partial [Panacagrimonas sp.]
GCVREAVIRDGRAQIELELGFPAAGYQTSLSRLIQEQVRIAFGVAADVRIGWRVQAAMGGAGALPGVRNIIAVASAKGGVGKSTVAANLALALRDEGARVGVLDADIYGPSQPRMLGAELVTEAAPGTRREPAEAHGLQVMSIGFFARDRQPMIWRGPMVTQALLHLLRETAWKDLDYLVIDLPPGTGDIQLTLAQQVPISGAIVVTTPQDIALIDAIRGLEMFQQVRIPVLGVVENMSGFCCPQCGARTDIFGSGGGAWMSNEHGVELLGQVPLVSSIREDADAGCPTVAREPDSAASAVYRAIARRAAARMAYPANAQGGPDIQVSDD